MEGSGTCSGLNILWGLIAACGEEGYREEVAIDLMELTAHRASAAPLHITRWSVWGEQIDPERLFHYARLDR